MRRTLLPGLLCVISVLALHGCKWWERAPRITGCADQMCQGLPIGTLAPDLVGEDSSGQPVRLSDHRGKVVAVGFWASWCVPCKRMLPHERALAAQLEGKPFVFIGVNSDKDREDLRRTESEFQLNYHSCFDGVNGPIVRQWGVTCWPTLYVIDRNGIIRFHPRNAQELEEGVAKLLNDKTKT